MRTLRHFPLAMAGTTLAFALSVSAMTASAASTFLLQFGQHPTEEAARAQWDALQSSHPDLLRDLSVRIAPVDGGFRTQASGVTSRDAAQETCTRLATAEVTCLVVETSMYTPEPLPQKFALSSNMTAQPEEPAVEYVPEQEMQGASADGIAPVEQPVIEPAAVTEEKKSFRQRFLPWLGGDEEEITQAQQQEPAVQDVALRPERISQPQLIEQPVIPQPTERGMAAQVSQELAQQPAQSQQVAVPAQEGQVVASRAPRPLQSPQSAPVQSVQVQSAQHVPVQPQMEAVPVQGAQGGAKIEVAEAIQVPLSFGNSAPVPVNKPVGHGGFPSQPIPERTLWVQLNHFASKEAAMGYWRQLAAQNPEMMRLLRVRIVTAWRTPGAGANQPSAATLRMGPFADQAEINRLCEVAKQQKLRCVLVQESGTSATLGTARRQPAAVENYSRRVATNRGYGSTGASPAGMFWVQLGAFGSVDEARKRWDELGGIHADVLGRMQPQISYPALSSSPTPVYHLRTGPFVSKSSAMNTCNSLQNRHVGCVVVQAR